MSKKASRIITIFTSALAVSASNLLVSPSPADAQHAPKDAYLPGEVQPYYGSEDEWDRRFFQDHSIKFYGRKGQRQMLDIVEGRTTEAAEYCKKLLRDDPDDLESWFNLAVAEAQLGNLDASLAAMRKSLERGLPFERFLAGPRDLLEPLRQTREFREIKAGKGIDLLHGPMLGRLTHDGASFWVRTVDEAPVRVRVRSTLGDSTPILSDEFWTRAESDYTATAEVDGLEPNHQYAYDLLISGNPVSHARELRFKTFPSSASGARFKVAFGGGAGYNPPNERMWNVISSQNPDALFLLGDNVYIDLPQPLCGLHNYTYYRRQSRPEFRQLVATTPVYAIWDDHDCAMDDVWMGPYREKPEWKPDAFKLFRRNWNNPGYGSPEWPGCWFRFAIGDVDFFMLDGRYYRTNPYGENPTMLGPVQKKWLLAELADSEAAFKVIVSPVPWSLNAKPGHVDTWNGFQEEREEIFSFIQTNRIDGVILLSADRHRSDVWKIDRPNGYPLYEFESSRLTNEHFHELIPGALFGYNAKCSFGLLEFDTTGKNPKVSYEIISIDNERIQSITVTRAEASY